MMDLQTLIVFLLILAAGGYAAWMFARKTRAFSNKPTCQDDCGCGGAGKKDTRTAH